MKQLIITIGLPSTFVSYANQNSYRFCCKLNRMAIKKRQAKHEYHRFLDEAGDTTFYGKGKVPIVGSEGVSKCFILGMLKVKEPLNEVRKKIVSLQDEIAADDWFKDVPSVKKKKAKMGYFLHAKDDLPEVRMKAYNLIKSIDCSFEAVVGRKIYDIYQNNHQEKESEFYADLLSHLLKNKMSKYEHLVLNIAHRSRCTTHVNLQKGLSKAVERSKEKYPNKVNGCKVSFNVQGPTKEPLLNVADYFCWAIQRVFERGEDRYYNYIANQIPIVVDLYDSKGYQKNQTYYGRNERKLSKANILP